MSWYHSNYKQRAIVGVDCIVLGSPAPQDVEITIPPDMAIFWDNIRSDAHDVILVDSNNNLLTFKRHSFTYATKTLVLQVDNLNNPNLSCIRTIFLYWNYAAAPSDLASVFSATSPRAGKIFLGLAGPKVVRPDIQASNVSNTPSAILTKTAAEEFLVFFEYESLLSKRGSEYQGKLNLEELDYAIAFSLNNSGVDDPGRYGKAETMFANGCIGVFVKAGSADNTYLIGARLKTTLQKTFDVKCFLEIRNKYPPT